MPTDAQTLTGYATLQVEWQESTGQELVGVALDQISYELSSLGGFVGLSSAIAKGFKPDAPAFERRRTFDPIVRRVHYGSPLLVELSIIREITENVGALAFLLYALKRSWGIDLELQAHREDMRHRFIEAKRKADAAQARVDRAWEEATARQKYENQNIAETAHSEIEHELGWGRGAASVVEGGVQQWGKARATVRIEDD